MLSKGILGKTFNLFGGESSSADVPLAETSRAPVVQEVLLSPEQHPERAFIDTILLQCATLEEKYQNRSPPPPFSIQADDITITRTPSEPKYVDTPATPRSSPDFISKAPIFVRRRIEMSNAPSVEVKQAYEELIGIPAQLTRESSNLATQISPNDLPTT